METRAPAWVRPRPEVEVLNWQDRANLVIEAADNPMHMAFLGIFEGGAPVPPEDLLRRVRIHVGERLERLPALRQVLGPARLGAAAGTWIEREPVDLGRHVLPVGLPPPGSETDLLEVAGRLLSVPLDRDRPLWEMWLVTGLSGGGFAVLLKVHHAVTDGFGLLQIAETLLDGAPPRTAPAGTSSPRRPLAWALAAAVARPAQLPLAVVTTLASAAANAWRGRRIRLNRPLGSRRALAVVRLRLDGVRRAAHSHGVKVNDVLLDLAAAGIGEAVRRRLPRSAAIRVLLAISPPGQHRGTRRNQSGAVLVSVPAGTAAAPPDLLTVARSAHRARRWQHPLVVERSLVAVAVTRLGRVLSRHQSSVDTAVSNLVGPPAPLYLLGRRMVDVVPVAPISGNVTIDFCAVSYAGGLCVGVLADAVAWPDLEIVAEGMRGAAGVLGIR